MGLWQTRLNTQQHDHSSRERDIKAELKKLRDVGVEQEDELKATKAAPDTRRTLVDAWGERTPERKLNCEGSRQATGTFTAPVHYFRFRGVDDGPYTWMGVFLYNNDQYVKYKQLQNGDGHLNLSFIMTLHLGRGDVYRDPCISWHWICHVSIRIDEHLWLPTVLSV